MNKALIHICCSFIFVNLIVTSCSQAAEITQQYSTPSRNKSSAIMQGYLDEAKLSSLEKERELEKLAGTLQKQAQSSPQTNILTIPQFVTPCLPENIKESSLRASTEYKGTAYYLVDLTVSRDDRTFGVNFDRILVSLTENECKLLTPPEKSDLLITASLAEFVPEAVANQLAFDRWKRRQKKLGNQEALQQDINEGTQPGPEMIELNPEDVWALKQLGITIPNEALDRLRSREADNSQGLRRIYLNLSDRQPAD